MEAMNCREQERLRLLNRLDSSKTHNDRNRLGQFATPTRLAEEIVRAAVEMLPRDSAIRFLEPGFGTGAFYSALLRAPESRRVASAIGYEIDAGYAEPCQRLWDGTPLRLFVRDFTSEPPPAAVAEKFNLVVSNPPYVRHHHLSLSQKRALRAATTRLASFELNGLSGLYTYFLVLSKAWMAPRGVGAWLVPCEFMDVNYGRKLRRFLLEEVRLARVHRFDANDVQFGDALVSSAVVFFWNETPPTDHEVVFTFGGTLAEPTSSTRVPADRLRHVSKWRAFGCGDLRSSTANGGVGLSDLFTIKRGVATGCNSFFVRSAEQLSQLDVPREFVTPILPSPKNLEVDEVAADLNGDPIVRKRLFLLSCDLPEAEIRARCPALAEYLEHGFELGIHKRYLCRHREPWYSQETRPPAPFLCTYMGRPTARSCSPFRFIRNRSQATAANVYLLLYPKPELAAALESHPGIDTAILKSLSSIRPETLTGEGRVYGGGLHKLEPSELGKVPADELLAELPAIQIAKQTELFTS
jgi:hypothetical protein